MGKMKSLASIDEYLERFPAATRKELKKLRATIKKCAPDAEEKISYGMPGALSYFCRHERS